MTSPLAHERIWLDKAKYDEAERQYFENLAKLLGIKNGMAVMNSSSLSSDAQAKSNRTVSSPKKKSQTSVLPEDIPPPPPPPSVSKKDLPELPPLPPSPQFVREVILTKPETTLQSHSKGDKKFKQKEAKEKRNKADKKGRERKSVNKDENKGSPNTPIKNSLAGEVAKARQHIKHSLECMDGIAALATNANVDLANRINSLEKKNSTLKKQMDDLQSLVIKLDNRVKTLEAKCSSMTASSGSPVPKKSAPTPSPAPSPSPAPKPSPAQPAKVEDDDDDGVDLFGSDSEEESEEAKRLKEERLAAYAAKKSKKPALIAKSNIILDVKPWDDETDMKEMETAVRAVSTDGLLWGASKLVPLAYGIHKLQISCVVEDDKVSVDWLQETIEQIEDYVQSVDIAAFNKV